MFNIVVVSACRSIVIRVPVACRLAAAGTAIHASTTLTVGGAAASTRVKMRLPCCVVGGARTVQTCLAFLVLSFLSFPMVALSLSRRLSAFPRDLSQA